MAVVLDAGALGALERRDRRAVALLKAAEAEGASVRVPAPVVGQVWRGGGGRQALLARFLRGFDVVAVDEARSRAAGVLLGLAGMSDVVDALVVQLTEAGDEVLTSDPDDIASLARAAGRPVVVTPV